MKVLRGKLKTILLYGIIIAVVLVGCFAAYPALTSRKESGGAEYKGILRLWQIDSFEGGRGSRASFQNGAARRFEAENKGIFILVTAHTLQSAENSISEGNIPDMISFGIGAEFAGDIARPLRGYTFPYSKIGKETYAYPWCRGGYFLFAAEGDFSDITPQNTVISQGGCLPELAAYCAGLNGDFPFESSLKAYVSLINGKYKYMLGTQRDVYRLITRQFSFQTEPLAGFSDLWQYISVCTDDPQKSEACAAFIAYLLSDDVQGLLPQIGMMSANRSIYDSSVPAMEEGETVRAEKSIYAFLSSEAIGELRSLALSALGGDKNGAKNLQNYLL